MQRLPRLVTPLLVVLLCALVAWWGMRLLPGAPIAIPPAPAADGGSGISRIDAVLASARLFGSRRPGVLSDNVRALGVVADASGHGSVIVSIDGQAAKVYRVGDTLDGRLVSAIRSDEIELESGGARQVFRLPPARAAANGLTIIGAAAAPDTASPYGPPESRVQGDPPAMQPQLPMSMPPRMQSQGQTMPPGNNQPGMPQGAPQQPPPQWRPGMLPQGGQSPTYQ